VVFFARSSRGIQPGNFYPFGTKVAGRLAGEHVRNPFPVISVRRPDHHRIAVNRHAAAEPVIRSAVARVQPVNLCPSGRKIAGCVARKNVHGPRVDGDKI